jgi:hypothetical protein
MDVKRLIDTYFEEHKLDGYSSIIFGCGGIIYGECIRRILANEPVTAIDVIVPDFEFIIACFPSPSKINYSAVDSVEIKIADDLILRFNEEKNPELGLAKVKWRSSIDTLVYDGTNAFNGYDYDTGALVIVKQILTKYTIMLSFDREYLEKLIEDGYMINHIKTESTQTYAVAAPITFFDPSCKEKKCGAVTISEEKLLSIIKGEEVRASYVIDGCRKDIIIKKPEGDFQIYIYGLDVSSVYRPNDEDRSGGGSGEHHGERPNGDSGERSGEHHDEPHEDNIKASDIDILKLLDS